MNQILAWNQSNVWVIWQQGKKKTLIFFLIFYSVFLGFCLKEHLTHVSERYYPASSNIGVFVYYPDFYLHWTIILIFALLFLFCPTRIFRKISLYFYGIVFSYFMIFFFIFYWFRIWSEFHDVVQRLIHSLK